MKACPYLGKAPWLFFLFTAGLPILAPAATTPNVALWDTSAPLPATPASAERTGWRLVPKDLLSLEANPPKASSDPGYYGREYVFRGDAVIENHGLTVAFSSATGRIFLYGKDSAGTAATSEPGASALGKRFLEILPLQAKSEPAPIKRFEVVQNVADEVALRVSFKTEPESSALFIFGRSEVLEIEPETNFQGLSLIGPMEYGIVPSFIGDDLIFSPAKYPDANTLSLPSENCFLGLLPGGASEFVLTWPKGKQQAQLHLGKEQDGKRLIDSIAFETAGQSVYLAALGAPGIWHKETLDAAYLEKDVTSQWKRPFPARWKTQLSEAGVTATYAFRDAKGEIWRGVPGSYTYPVWFEGDSARYHLSKKVPPEDESLVYFLEGQDTPLGVATPADILRETLGRSAADSILDLTGRKMRTHHRRGGDGVRRACTCGCTEAIQAIFEKGEEMAETNYIRGALDDMIYFVHCHVERIDEYRHFADDLVKFLQAQANAAPELKTYLNGLEQIARQIPQECDVQKENMKSFAYADDLARQTMVLTTQRSTNNLPAYMELLKAWRGMGGSQDYVVAQCHTITRKLCQEAGYTAVESPKAAALAEQIRARCRQVLRHPDGYEIWANY